jgi:hypothetical protein
MRSANTYQCFNLFGKGVGGADSNVRPFFDKMSNIVYVLHRTDFVVAPSATTSPRNGTLKINKTCEIWVIPETEPALCEERRETNE